MDLTDFDFELDDKSIALSPVYPRDTSKLLYLDKNNHHEDLFFNNLPDLLQEGDTIVLNETKVIPSYFECIKSRGQNKSKISLNLIEKVRSDEWLVLLKPKRRVKVNDKIIFCDKDKINAEVVSFEYGEHVKIRFNKSINDLDNWIIDNGITPLPHYITSKRKADDSDKTSYQTVYAKKNGSVAAPTAGLHFTDDLLKKISQKGINLCKVILHVGSGTFLPIKKDNIFEHKMHSEWIELSKSTAKILNKTKENSKRVIAVGTTSMRVLETVAQKDGIFREYKGKTNIYITPGHEFKGVDVLVTNFHLPKSSLFILVSAFYGLENIKRAYKHAMNNKYRFFSYGDACVIEKMNNDL